MIYEWVRLLLAAVGILPPLSFVVLIRPRRRLLAPLPAWVTWSQSLAQVLLYVGIVAASAAAIDAGRVVLPPPWAQAPLLVGLAGLIVTRWVLLVWWLQDRWRSRRPPLVADPDGDRLPSPARPARRLTR